MITTTEKKTELAAILFDDGEYFIERSIICGRDQRSGFLLRRCEASKGVSCGYECIGQYESIAGRKWRASIDLEQSIEREEDYLILGLFDSLEAAAVALWERRKEAFFRHK